MDWCPRLVLRLLLGDFRARGSEDALGLILRSGFIVLRGSRLVGARKFEERCFFVMLVEYCDQGA